MDRVRHPGSDFLVIGSGIAGLSFAIHAARFGSVVLVTKKSDSDSNTNHAQGGIACVLDPADDFQLHIEDTLQAGRGLCNAAAVDILVREGPDRIRELLEWGTRFSVSRSSPVPCKLDLGKEGGHSKSRIVHAHDLTGAEVERALLEKARSERAITLLENHCAVDLITSHHVPREPERSRCYGAYVLDTTTHAIFAVPSRMTCLATGGAGRVYLHTTNPDIASCDGVAMAYRAGASIANMEFIQFHPTTLYHERGESFLISEAVRGHGGILRNRLGQTFMDACHPMKSLAPRDVVAQAIDREMKRTGEPCVYLDVRHIRAPELRRRFPNIFARCKSVGIDITRDLIPVVPAAHYLCGGVRVGLDGTTDIKNLYACGETSCTGVHGANRLASNSLLEALVFSRRAAIDSGGKLKSVKPIPAHLIPPWDDSATLDTEEWILLSHNRFEIQSAMWDYVGIVRSDIRLHRARRRIALLQKEIENYYKRTKITPALLDLRNIVTAAQLIIASALRRKESRGLHFTTDYPDQDDRHWNRDTILVKRPGP